MTGALSRPLSGAGDHRQAWHRVRGIELCSASGMPAGRFINPRATHRLIAASGPARLAEDKALNLKAVPLGSTDTLYES